MSMKRFIRGEKAFDRLLNALAVCASVLIFFIMCAVCYEVVARYFFNSPTTWVVEICSIILLFTPFLVASWVLRKDGHVKMDLILDQFDQKNQALIRAITSVVASIACIILVYYGAKLAWDFYKTNYFTNTLLRLPKSPLLSIIPFGFLLLFIQTLRRARDNIEDWVRLRAQKHDLKEQE